jgi:hypothetical protein
MSNEEFERQKEFILNNLARVSAKLDAVGDKLDGLAVRVDGIAALQEKSELERKADEVRIGRLEESFTVLTQLVQRHQEWHENHQSRIDGIEEALVILTRLANEGRNGQA